MKKYLAAAVALVSLIGVLAAQAGEDGLRLDLGAGDIQDVKLEGSTVLLKLTPSGTEQLKQITELNYGSVLELSVDGIYAVKATIFSTIDSGVVQVSHPSPELLDKLKRY